MLRDVVVAVLLLLLACRAVEALGEAEDALVEALGHRRRRSRPGQRLREDPGWAEVGERKLGWLCRYAHAGLSLFIIIAVQFTLR